ncbi:hypothetical protein F383_36051 [Gossypium arboreum]|uniref:Uncharacterized protein n=1 Tax=Gossypium arboreum TaxID=29729 RepID=A0A0B0PYZ1_GOSAR|nr:hypothetical protein F383_36051 [Gossypium arboreum]
MYRNLATFGKI